MFEALVDRARRERRRICAFTSHDLTAVREHFGVELGLLYLDAHKLAKRAFNRARWPSEPRLAEWSLASFEAHLGLPRPNHLKPGSAAKRLRCVSTQLARRGSFARLTPTKKAQWTKLLAYNEVDVAHMAAVARWAARAAA